MTDQYAGEDIIENPDRASNGPLPCFTRIGAMLALCPNR